LLRMNFDWRVINPEKRSRDLGIIMPLVVGEEVGFRFISDDNPRREKNIGGSARAVVWRVINPEREGQNWVELVVARG
jgi:hypothetical protein